MVPPALRSVALLTVVLTVLVGACSDGGSDGGTDPGPGEQPSADEVSFHASLDHLERDTVTLVRADDGERVEVEVVVAATREERGRGLMEVPELAGGTGMLFDFGEERHGGFWMKDTLIPLDIGFAAADGEVLAVLTMEPCDADPCPTYDPSVAYRYALEVPEGWFDANDLGVGDRLVLSEDG